MNTKNHLHHGTDSNIQKIREVTGVGMCGVAYIEFNWCIVAGLNSMGYFGKRYCFEEKILAELSLSAWNEAPHPPGPWVSCRGFGIDLINASPQSTITEPA